MWAHIQVKVNVYAVVSHMHADLGWHGNDNFPSNVILICAISPVYCHSTMMLWQLSNSLTPFAVVVGSIFSELQALLLLLYSMSTHLLCLPLPVLFCWEESHCLAHPLRDTSLHHLWINLAVLKRKTYCGQYLIGQQTFPARVVEMSALGCSICCIQLQFAVIRATVCMYLAFPNPSLATATTSCVKWTIMSNFVSVNFN